LVDLLQTDESNPQEVKVITALERLFRQNAASFVGMQETQNMIKAAEAQYPDLCGEVLRALPLQRVAEVLRRLVDEHISIRHLREILESLISWGMREKDVIALTEYIRVDLGRFTIHKHLDTDKKLQAILLSPEFEDIFRQAIQVSNNEHIMLDPQQSQHLVTELGVLLKGHSDKPVVLLASMDIRRYVKKHLQDFIPSLSVLSYQEVGASIVLQALGQITPMSP
jgi:type III secretion protein V